MPKRDTPRPARARASSAHPRRRWLILLGIEILVLLALAAVLVLRGGDQAPPADAPSGGGGPADTDEAVRTVEITALGTMTFNPAAIDVAAGQTVTFEVTNTTQDAGLFVLGDAEAQRTFAEALTHLPEGPPHDLPYLIRLAPSETKQLTWRFGDPGMQQYAWYQPGNSNAAMFGQVTIG
jgi:uncharacterized cupredoxin-like copper-binding protein